MMATADHQPNDTSSGVNTSNVEAVTTSHVVPRIVYHPTVKQLQRDLPFVEREWIAQHVSRPELEAQLHSQIPQSNPPSDNTSSTTIVIWGYPGTGKTHLVLNALAACSRVYQHIFWIRAQDPELTNQDLRAADAAITGIDYSSKYDSVGNIAYRRRAKQREELWQAELERFLQSTPEKEGDPAAIRATRDAIDHRLRLADRNRSPSPDPDLAVRFGLIRPDDEEDILDVVRTRVADWIKGRDGRCLCIIDGVNNNLTLESIMPSTSSVDYLVTTRQLSLRSLATHGAIDVGAMTTAQALQVWDRHGLGFRPSSADEVHLQDLMERLGGLPAAFVRTTHPFCIQKGYDHRLSDIVRTISTDPMYYLGTADLPRSLTDPEENLKIIAHATIPNYLQCGMDGSPERWVASLKAGPPSVLDSYHPSNAFGRFILRLTILRMLAHDDEMSLWPQLTLHNTDEAAMESLVRACDEASLPVVGYHIDQVYDFLRDRSTSIDLVAKDGHRVPVRRPFLVARSYAFRTRFSPPWNDKRDDTLPVEVDMSDLEVEVVRLLSELVHWPGTSGLAPMRQRVEDLPEPHFRSLCAAFRRFSIEIPNFSLPTRPGIHEDEYAITYKPKPPIVQRGGRPSPSPRTLSPTESEREYFDTQWAGNLV